MKNKTMKAFVELMRLSHRIKRLSRTNLEELGFPLNQYMVLLRIEPGEILTTTEISNRLIRQKSNITPIIESLVKKNIIKRVHDEKDRRFIRLTLTEEGIKIRENVIKEHSQLIEEIFRDFNSEEIEQLFKQCKYFNEHINIDFNKE